MKKNKQQIKKQNSEEITHQKLKQHIISLIYENGFLTIDQFMDIVINYYYVNNKNTISEVGDFITAPEISQMFGEMIGIYFSQKWLQYIDKIQSIQNTQSIENKKAKIIFIELGGGYGTLMSDILRSTKNINQFHQNISDIIMIENSNTMLEKQLNTINRHINKYFSNNSNTSNNIKLHSYNNIYKLLEIDFSENGKYQPIIFIVANEFFDALPLKQFKYIDNQGNNKCNNGFYELCVYYKDGELCVGINPGLKYAFDKANVIKTNVINNSTNLNDNILEVSPVAKNITEGIISLLQKYIDKRFNDNINVDSALIIDYGYITSPMVSTIQAIYKHTKQQSIFNNLGIADISALVDFHALSAICKNKNIKHNILTQRDFLLNYGIISRSKALIKNGADAIKIEKQLNKLINFNEMGELFKVLEIIN